MKKSKLGFWCASVYWILIVVAVVYALYRFNFAPVNSEFAGLHLIVLTLPWSMMAFSRLGSYLGDSLLIVILILFACAALNSAIIYFLAALIGSLGKSKLK